MGFEFPSLRRRVMFGLGISAEKRIYRPTFNVHLKTAPEGGAENHGFPDETYFQRAMEELTSSIKSIILSTPSTST